jgi:hypothetical protein
MPEPGSRCKDQGMSLYNDQDIERIKEIIQAMSLRYQAKDGAVTFAGVENGTVKVAPAGFCWR